ncbi:MAG: hypothetical protein IJ607_01890 [Bacteroidaceae bacterium]|nr:hypothetical protein [Bacteroidaceae bacterium]
MTENINMSIHGSDQNVNEGTALDGAVLAQTGQGIEQQNTAATGSAVEAAGMDDSQVEDTITHYEAWRYTLHTDYLRLAKKVKVRTKKPKHPVLGEAQLECYTKSALTNTEKSESVELPLYKNDMSIFPAKSTIRVFGQKGYDANGVADGSQLMLYVVKNDRGTSVTVEAINGPMENGKTYVPDIPAGTKLRCMASALSESDLKVASSNFIPTWKQAYLQKKACAITYTDFYQKMKKLAEFGGQMVTDMTLADFRTKTTSTLLFGAPRETTVWNDDLGVYEHCYYQEGLLTQVPNRYQLSGIPTVADIIAISRMAFTRYAKVNTVQAYCGTLFMEWLSNMDFSEHPEIKFLSVRDDLDVKVGKFETNFGTIEFKIDASLDENDMSGYCLIIPMKESIRYIYEEKTVAHDHKNDTNARDAKSRYYIVDDCLMLTGMTSILVGKDVSSIGVGDNSDILNIISVKDLSKVTTPDSTAVYYLTDECIVGDEVLLVGPYTYTGGKWTPWSGNIEA